MKKLILAFVILGVFGFSGWLGFQYWQTHQKQVASKAQTTYQDLQDSISRLDLMIRQEKDPKVIQIHKEKQRYFWQKIKRQRQKMTEAAEGPLPVPKTQKGEIGGLVQMLTRVMAITAMVLLSVIVVFWLLFRKKSKSKLTEKLEALRSKEEGGRFKSPKGGYARSKGRKEALSANFETSANPTAAQAYQKSGKSVAREEKEPGSISPALKEQARQIALEAKKKEAREKAASRQRETIRQQLLQSGALSEEDLEEAQTSTSSRHTLDDFRSSQPGATTSPLSQDSPRSNEQVTQVLQGLSEALQTLRPDSNNPASTPSQAEIEKASEKVRSQNSQPPAFQQPKAQKTSKPSGNQSKNPSRQGAPPEDGPETTEIPIPQGKERKKPKKKPQVRSHNVIKSTREMEQLEEDTGPREEIIEDEDRIAALRNRIEERKEDLEPEDQVPRDVPGPTDEPAQKLPDDEIFQPTRFDREREQREDILKLSRRGYTSSEISRRLRIPQDQVEIIIRMQRDT
jgi:hypothetical protein